MYIIKYCEQMNVPGKSFCFVNVINMFVPQKFLDHF